MTKTNRIVRIIYVGNFQRIAISVKEVITPMLIFIGVNVLILTLFTALSPLQWERETLTTDVFGRPTASFGQCQSAGALPYIIILCIVNLGCLVAGVFQAYKARHLSTDFAESEYIALAMALLLVVGFIAIPVTIIAKENSGAFFFVVTAVVFVCSMSLLLLIFIPKLNSMQLERQGVSRSSYNTRAPSMGQFSSNLVTSSLNEGVTCINKEMWLPKLKRDNQDLIRLIDALETRIRHLEEEQCDSNHEGPERARLLLEDKSKVKDSVTDGVQVRDMSEELNDARSENKRMRRLRVELEARLNILENPKPPSDAV